MPHCTFKGSTPTIKFISEMSYTEMPFFDLLIYVKYDITLHTRLYMKPTDKHVYPNYQSGHGLILIMSIVYSQFLRLKDFTLSWIIY